MSETFFITIGSKEGRITGHGVSTGAPVDLASAPDEQQPATPDITSRSVRDFSEIMESFKSSMDLYLKFVSLLLSFSNVLSNAIAGQTILDFAKAKGTLRTDLSSESESVYELHMSSWREFTVRQGETLSALQATEHLPQVMIIGLISSYDFHLAQLIRVILNRHPEILFTSERTVSFAELIKYSSIDEVRDTILTKEIEAVLRNGHHEHFAWMEKTFSLKLRQDLKVWPAFIELCERRNLFTHTGGIVQRSIW